MRGFEPRVSTSVVYTGTPFPNGPRSVNLPRALPDSATKSPLRVPMVRITRSAMFSLRRLRA